jgi:NADPH2:quinone reductase
MSKAIRIHATGGPDVMQWEDLPTPEPRPNEVLLRHEAIGLNYIDIYYRTGLYRTALPAVLGMEGAGIVCAVGSEVTDVTVGDRVAYAGGPLGAYATERVIPADRLVKVPDSIPSTVAGTMMLQGMTAQYLLRRTYKVQSGDTILVHSAAGGVGLIMCQWARHLGATVIGVVSTPEKAALAQSFGASHVIVGHDRLEEEVKQITKGAMVPVVYDSVGRDTFAASIDCLAPLGMMVSYGNASGAVPPLDIAVLTAKGSLFLTRPSLATYTAKRADLHHAAGELFALVENGVLSINVNQSFALQDAAMAHEALEARRTTGSTVLIP